MADTNDSENPNDPAEQEPTPAGPPDSPAPIVEPDEPVGPLPHDAPERVEASDADEGPDDGGEDNGEASSDAGEDSSGSEESGKAAGERPDPAGEPASSLERDTGFDAVPAQWWLTPDPSEIEPPDADPAPILSGRNPADEEEADPPAPTPDDVKPSTFGTPQEVIQYGHELMAEGNGHRDGGLEWPGDPAPAGPEDPTDPEFDEAPGDVDEGPDDEPSSEELLAEEPVEPQETSDDPDASEPTDVDSGLRQTVLSALGPEALEELEEMGFFASEPTADPAEVQTPEEDPAEVESPEEDPAEVVPPEDDTDPDSDCSDGL